MKVIYVMCVAIIKCHCGYCWTWSLGKFIKNSIMASGVKLHHAAIVFDDYLVCNTWNVDTMYHSALWRGNVLAATSQSHDEQYLGCLGTLRRMRSMTVMLVLNKAIFRVMYDRVVPSSEIPV